MTRQEAIELLSSDVFKLCMVQLCDPLCEACYEALNMAIEALDQPTVQTIQDSCITIHGISSKYLEDKHTNKILVYTEKGCRTYHWFGDDEE